MTGMVALLSLLGWPIGGTQGLKWLLFIGLIMANLRQAAAKIGAYHQELVTPLVTMKAVRLQN